jgi:hypothetical protein
MPVVISLLPTSRLQDSQLWHRTSLHHLNTVVEASIARLKPDTCTSITMSPYKNTSTSPLTERSANSLSPTKPVSKSPGDNKFSMPRFEMPQRVKDETDSQTYISPSDAIRSPTTKKLSEIKGKRFAYVTPSRAVPGKYHELISPSE